MPGARSFAETLERALAKLPAGQALAAGGTLAGVQALVERGYFERLGVSTLWLSPVYTNPRGQLPGRLHDAGKQAQAEQTSDAQSGEFIPNHDHYSGDEAFIIT